MFYYVTIPGFWRYCKEVVLKSRLYFGLFIQPFSQSGQMKKASQEEMGL